MSKQVKLWLALYAALILCAAAAPVYALEIGSWEAAPDGWIDWGEGQISVDDPTLMPGKYDYDTVGATLGSQSLKLTDQGWGQTLAIKLNADQRAAFMANSMLSIDYSVAADTLGVGGYARIQGIAFNADGLSWTEIDLADTENFWFWDGSPQRTQTFIYDYSDLKASINPNPGFVEIILITNGQRDTDPAGPFDLYFDNAQLTGASKAYNELVAEDNPILYLKFETTPLVDSSGSDFWVWRNSGASIQPYTGIGNAVYLDGSSAGCVAAAASDTEPSWGDEIGDEYAFAKGAISFEFWARVEAIAQYGMFFQQIGTYEREEFAPGFGQAGPEADTFGSLRILNGTRDPEDADFWYPADANTPTDGQWHHYVVTYDEQYEGDPNLMQIQLFLDGQLIDSAVVGGGEAELPALLGPEMDHLVIGGENNRGSVYNTFTGYVDEFAIYDYILGAERVAIHYAQGSIEIEPQTCQEVFLRGQGLAADFDKNCVIDLRDFVYVAESWLLCNDPILFGVDPDCGPTW